MAELRQIVITLPSKLLQEVGGVAEEQQCTVSQCFEEAVCFYLQLRKREQMRRGYEEMADINLCLAEEDPMLDVECFSLSSLSWMEGKR